MGALRGPIIHGVLLLGIVILAACINVGYVLYKAPFTTSRGALQCASFSYEVLRRPMSALHGVTYVLHKCRNEALSMMPFTASQGALQCAPLS